MAKRPPTNHSGSDGVPKAPPKGIPDHELVRCIGRGSYGDVWLTRNIIGTYRAVKIVYRSTFEDVQPYEREFNGIKKFEPVSRSHEGFVDVLQVGRNDAEGYFYYVMELGDDSHSGQEIDPAKYEAKTLATEKSGCGRFAFGDCLSISLALTSALAYLHEKGLVHRDIKPSNIIFVSGVPKLADIGLVAQVGEAESFVGTVGFIPPEGPGNPQADLYSLGKVIYEISMGKDRLEHPSLPSDWGEGPEPEKWLELNEIILRACEPDPKERYSTAKEMLEDLEVLQAGKSVRRLRVLERRWAVISRAGLTAAVSIFLVAGLWYLIYREHKKEREARERQARSSVAYGSRLMEEGNLFGALPWFADALELERGDALKERTHRVRINAVTRQCPRLQQCWVQEGQPYFGRFSPDGQWLATANTEGAILIYDLTTAKVAAPVIYHGRGKGARTVCFSPDGQVLLTTGSDNFARRWNWKTGQEILPALEHAAEVYSAEFSPDGSQVVSGCDDHQAYLWDAASSRRIRLLTGHGNKVLFAAFSPDGRKIVTSSEDFSAWIWDAASGERGPRLWHKHWVYYAVFSPDNQSVVTASFDNTAQLWSASTGQLRFKPLLHLAAVASAEFSPDGRYLVTAGWDFAARVWDIRTGELANSPLEHGGQVMHCSFAPDGRHIATVSTDRTVRVWDLEANHWLPPSVPAVFSPAGNFFFVLSNSVVRVGEHWTGHASSQPLLGAPPIEEIVFNRPGTHLLAVSATSLPGGVPGRAVQVWNLARRTPVGPIGFSTNMAATWALSDDAQQAIGKSKTTFELLDSSSGKVQFHTLEHAASADEFAVSPNGRYFVTLNGATAFICETASGRIVAPPLVHACPVLHAEFSSDSRRLVTACSDKYLERRYAQVWNVPEGKPWGHPLQHKDGVLSATFSPDGRWIATASEDFTARIWDVDSSEETVPPLRHLHQVFEVQFSPDSRWVVTASRDSTARVWDVLTGDALTPPLRHPTTVRHAQFIEHGAAVWTKTGGGQAFIWDLQPETRPIEDIMLMAEFQSGHQVIGSGHARSQTQNDLLDQWQKLQALNYWNPAHATPMRLWHERQVESCERHNQGFAARFHLNFLISTEPANGNLFGQRAEANAGLSRWQEAQEDFLKAVALGSETVSLDCQLARVYLARGQIEPFRFTCQKLLKECSGVPDQALGNTITATLALAPASIDDFSLALKLAHRLVLQKTFQERNSIQALGALQYRDNHFEEAVKTLSKNLHLVGDEAMVESWLFLSMAQSRLNRAEPALQWLAKAQEWIKEALQEKPYAGSGYLLSWQRRLDLIFLSQEAQRLNSNRDL